jgi:hypothetical protein
MGMSAETIIETICPELSGSPSLQVYLGMAVEGTDRRFFGSMYEQAVACLAAHYYEVFSGSSGSLAIDKLKELGGGARIASATEGKLSVSFAQQGAAAGSSASNLGDTKYGRMLLSLKRSRPRMGVAGGVV